MLYFISPILLYFVYLLAARFRLRQLAYGKHDPGLRIERLGWWAEFPLSPVKTEARLLWAEAVRPVNKAEAWDILNQALEAEGRRSVPARLLAGRWAMQDQWPEHAARHFSKALSLLQRRKDGLLRARIHRLRAEIALRANEPAAALLCCDESLQDNAYDSEVRLLRASVRFHEGDPAGALLDYGFLEQHFGNPALRTRVAMQASIADVASRDLTSAAERVAKLIKENAGNIEQLQSRLACVQGLAGQPVNDLPVSGAVEGYAAIGRQEWELAQRKLAEALFAVNPTDSLAGEMMWLLAGALRATGNDMQALEMEARIRAIWPRSPYLQTAWTNQTDIAAERVSV